MTLHLGYCSNVGSYVRQSWAALLLVLCVAGFGLCGPSFGDKAPVKQVDCGHRGVVTWTEFWDAPAGSDYSTPLAVGKAIAALEKCFDCNRGNCTDGCFLTGLGVEDGSGNPKPLSGPPYDKNVWDFTISSGGLVSATMNLKNGDKITAFCTTCDI